MFELALRFIIILYCCVFILVYLLAGLSYQAVAYDELNNFLDSDETCDTKPCFLGIVPAETDADTIEKRLKTNSYISKVDIVDIQTQLHHINWEWNSTQPSVITEAGYVRYRTDLTAAYIVLKPDLNLAELWIAFGEPDVINEDSYYLHLSYRERGLIVRLIPNCRAVWYSDVWIDIDERITYPIYEDFPLYAAIDHLCVESQSWP